MDYAKAKAIAAQVAPTLLVDDLNPQHPAMFVVRKGPGATPFSIHLSTLTGDFAAGKTVAEITAQETKLLTDALDAALS